MTSAAIALLQVAAAECAAQAAGFSPVEAAAGLLAADELRALFLPLARTQGGGTAASAGVSPKAARQAVAVDQAPLTLLQLPAEVLLLVIGRLNARSRYRHVPRALQRQTAADDSSRGIVAAARCGSRPRVPGSSAPGIQVVGSASRLARVSE